MKFMVFVACLVALAHLSLACKDVGSQRVFVDEKCSNGESIGCNAGGQGQNCRFCGSAPFPPCPGGGGNNGGNSGNNGGNNNGNNQGDVPFAIINNCPYTIWVGFQGKSKTNWKLPNAGGWQLTSGQRTDLNVPRDLEASRIWGRTGCRTVNGQFTCETGDCGPWVQCAHDGIERGGQPPATLAEFTLNGWGDQDYYDVSLVDGFNIPMTIKPKTPNRDRAEGNEYWCTTPNCLRDLNQICPPELQKKNSNGQVVACMSACEKFRTDVYCCHGEYNRPETCKPSNWAVNYPGIFKTACPTSYSFAYDDHTSTFFCNKTGYDVIFC